MEGLEERALLAAFEAKVDFRPDVATTPAGYVGDAGGVFGARQGSRYGWNVDHRDKVFDRDSGRARDGRYDTIVELPGGEGAPFWEMQVPAGTYVVRVVAGDPATFNHAMKIKAEGVVVVEGNTTKNRAFLDGTTVVVVKDGRLTLRGAKGSRGNRVAFVEITQVRDPGRALEAEHADSTQGLFSDGDVVRGIDAGDHLAFENVLFDGAFRSIQARLGVSALDDGMGVEFRLDSPAGKLIAKLKAEGAGPDEKSVRVRSVDVASVTGIHDLYVVFKGTHGAAVDSLRFGRERVLRIMPLGDSLTESVGGHASYRWGLWRMLQRAGHSVDFVGSQSGVRPGSGEPLFYDFDTDHAGFAGYGTEGILTGGWRLKGGVAPMFARHPADVVLIHVGTNDLYYRDDPDASVDRIGRIIAALRAVNPEVIVLLAQVFPTQKNVVTLEQVEALNRRIGALAPRISTESSPVVLVDQYTGFDYARHTYDQVHPTVEAEWMMAGRWYGALAGVIGSG